MVAVLGAAVTIWTRSWRGERAEDGAILTPCGPLVAVQGPADSAVPEPVETTAQLLGPPPARYPHCAGVTRPNRPGINVDMEPPAVKLNDALGGILTWKLAGEAG